MEDIMTDSVERKFQIVKKFLDNNEFKQDIIGMFFAEILSNSQLDEAGKIRISSHKVNRRPLNGNQLFDIVSKLKQNKVDYIEHSVVKTIAAFLNTHPGGTLLIGVGEDENQKGVVRGNHEDDFQI